MVFNFFIRQYIQQKKFFKDKENIVFNLFYLLASFFLGNIFGIFTKSLNLPLFSFILLIFFELINKWYFEKNKYFTFINFLKQGFLLGIFIEAFKVGS